ncbi:hypothetical protein D3M95_10900 [Corynebacterium falsenii]|uniref:Uncharacterized protein n=1 Tax=Corynebacterium falsenii TaxID=108486 RepID=A0A418Q4K8_9CORY|nr:hypothetical protein D3M95_10900 [Corynebacterium falsenii]
MVGLGCHDLLSHAASPPTPHTYVPHAPASPPTTHTPPAPHTHAPHTHAPHTHAPPKAPTPAAIRAR